MSVCVSLVQRLVVFADSESAKRAVRELNDSELEGRRLFLREVCASFSVVGPFLLCVFVLGTSRERERREEGVVVTTWVRTFEATVKWDTGHMESRDFKEYWIM